MYVKIREKLTASMHRLGDWRYVRNIPEKLAEKLGCPLGNQTIKSGCPAPFYGCPGRPDTRFVKPCLLFGDRVDHLEGSRNFDLFPSFLFMTKKGNFLLFFVT